LGTARAKWAAGSRRSVDYKILEAVYPEAYAATVVTNPSRRLTVADVAEIGETTEIETPTAERTRRKITTEAL
jgi:hypothetical protein